MPLWVTYASDRHIWSSLLTVLGAGLTHGAAIVPPPECDMKLRKPFSLVGGSDIRDAPVLLVGDLATLSCGV